MLWIFTSYYLCWCESKFSAVRKAIVLTGGPRYDFFQIIIRAPITLLDKNFVKTNTRFSNPTHTYGTFLASYYLNYYEVHFSRSLQRRNIKWLGKKQPSHLKNSHFVLITTSWNIIISQPKEAKLITLADCSLP